MASDRFSVAGRAAVVTGAAQGIGAAIARAFAEADMGVVIADVNVERGNAAAAAIGPNARFLRCDVGARADLEAAVAHAHEHFGRLDVWVNNAVRLATGSVLELDEAGYDASFAISLRAPFFATQVAAHDMIANGRNGVIINMSSINALVNVAEYSAYSIAKGGINQLTRSAALALAPYGIRVCAIGPGTVRTEASETTVLATAEATRQVLSRTPLGRAAEPDEIASIALFLASDAASYITGQTVYADGGRLSLNYMVPVPD